MKRKFLLTALTVATVAISGLWYETARPTAEAATGHNYGQYSRMFARSAGQFWSGGAKAGQWAWRPVSSTESHITWSGGAKERFVRSGDWVMLDGWWDNGTYYRQRITLEQIGDGRCQNLRTLAVTGRQRYVRWGIPSHRYCLITHGRITEMSSGKTILFKHQQTWSPPAACSNRYFSGKTCLTQTETWWDNRGSVGLSRKLSRSVRLARWTGMAFTVRQTYPRRWGADLRYTWTW